MGLFLMGLRVRIRTCVLLALSFAAASFDAAADMAVLERSGKPALLLSRAIGGRSETEVIAFNAPQPDGTTKEIKTPGQLDWLDYLVERPLDSRTDLWKWREVVTGKNPESARENVTLIWVDFDGIERTRQRLTAAWPGSVRVNVPGPDGSAALESALLIHEGSSTSSDPVVQMVSPLSGTTFWNPTGIVVRASAQFSGLVKELEFFSGAQSIGSDLSASSGQFELAWQNPPAGDHILSAVATDFSGDMHASHNQALVSIRFGLTYDEWRRTSGHFNSVEATNASLSGPLADPDNDRAFNLMEYAANTDPRNPAISPGLKLERDTQGLRLTYRRRQGGDASRLSYYRYADVAYIVESSADLRTWTEATGLFSGSVLESDAGGQTETVSLRLASDPRNAVFLRLRIQLLPLP